MKIFLAHTFAVLVILVIAASGYYIGFRLRVQSAAARSGQPMT